MFISKWIKQNWKYAIKYTIVGASGTAIDIFGFAGLLKYTNLNRFIAATISFIAAVVNNYTWNKKWTFHDRNKAIGGQFFKFLVVSIGGLLLNLFFLWLFGQAIAQFQSISANELSVGANSFAKLGASGMVLTYNFLMNRYWTFKPESSN